MEEQTETNSVVIDLEKANKNHRMDKMEKPTETNIVAINLEKANKNHRMDKMEKPTETNIVAINLEKANKNHRMDICCRICDTIENGLIIVFRCFGSLTYYPDAHSDPRVKKHLKNNNCRKCSSLSHCLYCLDQNKINVIIVSENTFYLTYAEDSLVSILFDPPNIHGTLYEFDSNKNGIREKNNCNSDVKIQFSLELSVNIQQATNQVKRINNCKILRRSRLLPLKPREQKIASIYWEKTIPVYRVEHNSPPLIDVINSINHSSLSGGKLPYGDIVQDCAGSNSLDVSSTTQRHPILQTDGRENPAHHPTMSHNNATPIGQSNEATSIRPVYSNQSQNGQRQQSPKHPRYSTYDARKASYATFSEFRNLDTDLFARTGLFYIGEADTVKCFQCGTELQNWNTGKDPVTEHVKKSPDCYFLKDNLGAEYEARVMSSGRISTGEISSSTSNNGGATGSASQPPFTASVHIRSPQYQVYSVRLSTFAKWPPSMTQKPEQVAQAGFYYTGLQDIVRCFACDGGLKNWDPEDEPWIEHARWFPQCPYVQEVKGREFVDLVRRMTEESDEEEDAVVHSTFQRNNPMANSPDLQQLSIGNDPDEPCQLETYAAQIVLQTGYSRSAVAMAIDVLISKGIREYTAQDIMGVILEKEERGEALPTDGNSDSSQSFRTIPVVSEDTETILRENKSLKLVVTCIKCKVQARNTLFLPCTHHCLCQVCAEKCSLCPVCYKVIKQKIKTFMI